MNDMHAHGQSEIDYRQVSFFIRKLDTSGSIKAAEIPAASIPLTCFVYLTGGELLVETNGDLFQCMAGHLLLIPEKQPFSIRYYQDACGYTGGFSLSAAGQGMPVAKPVHRAFWFDEAGFVGELFHMMFLSFDNRRNGFITKSLDLLLSMLDIPVSTYGNPMAARFLEQIFNPEVPFGQLDDYAREARLTPNGFCRMIRRESGRSPGEWIALARLTRAKRLLQETDVPVVEVAWSVGLDDQSYFSRFFRKQTGMTPLAFRQKMKAMHG